jgi:hypothetical protein
MERGRYTMARSFSGLGPEHVGRRPACAAAPERSQGGHPKVPVVSNPRTARSPLDNIFEAVHGMSIYRRESFSPQTGRKSGE